MQWQEIIEFLGGVTAISVTIGYLGKKVIDAFLLGRIESYKKDLERIASENSVRFQRLHSERAEIIKEVYSKLALLDDTLHSTLKPFQVVGEMQLEDKVESLSIQFNELREYFLPKRIFFENSVCELIDKILESAIGVFFEITTHPISISDSNYKQQKSGSGLSMPH